MNLFNKFAELYEVQNHMIATIFFGHKKMLLINSVGSCLDFAMAFSGVIL